jgi:hypothetical protein
MKKKNNTTEVKGIYFLESRKKWKSVISLGCKIYGLGSYANRNDAVSIRKEAEARKSNDTFLEWYENSFKPLLTNKYKLRIRRRNANKDGYAGVDFSERLKKWRVQIGFGPKVYCLGSYDDQDSAIAIRKEAEKRKLNNTFFTWYEKKINWRRQISDETKSLIKKGELLSTVKVAKMLGTIYQSVTKYAIDTNMTMLGGKYYFNGRDIEKLKEYLDMKRGIEGKKPKDITGRKNGMLTAIRPTGQKKGTLYVWVWKCGYCGKEIEYTNYEVFHNNRTSCGCKRVDIHSKIAFYKNTNIDHIRSTKISKNNTSGIRGVRYHKKEKMWYAYIGFKKKWYYLGRYTSKEEAGIARRNAEIKYFQTTIKEFEEYIKSKRKNNKTKRQAAENTE